MHLKVNSIVFTVVVDCGFWSMDCFKLGCLDDWWNCHTVHGGDGCPSVYLCFKNIRQGVAHDGLLALLKCCVRFLNIPKRSSYFFLNLLHMDVRPHQSMEVMVFPCIYLLLKILCGDVAHTGLLALLEDLCSIPGYAGTLDIFFAKFVTYEC